MGFSPVTLMMVAGDKSGIQISLKACVGVFLLYGRVIRKKIYHNSYYTKFGTYVVDLGSICKMLLTK